MMENLREKQIEARAKEERRAYMREWRRKNKDRVKEYNERYWKKRAIEKMDK